MSGPRRMPDHMVKQQMEMMHKSSLEMLRTHPIFNDQILGRMPVDGLRIPRNRMRCTQCGGSGTVKQGELARSMYSSKVYRSARLIDCDRCETRGFY